jgi:hypothetical protein
MRRDYCVYKHTSPSGKVYIGITHQEPTRRWQNGFGYRLNEYFFRAIVKYGWDSFKHEVLLSGLTKEEACAAEVALIAAYRSNEKDFGYNISAGGEHSTPTEETRRKIGVKNKGRKPYNTGKHLSAEHRRKISEHYAGGPTPYAVVCLELCTTYQSIKAAALALGIQDTSSIYRCLNGTRKTAGGYHWRRQYHNE